MQNVLGIPDAINNTEFEYRTAGGGYIDMLYPDSSFLVEQKSKNVDLISLKNVKVIPLLLLNKL